MLSMSDNHVRSSTENLTRNKNIHTTAVDNIANGNALIEQGQRCLASCEDNCGPCHDLIKEGTQLVEDWTPVRDLSAKVIAENEIYVSTFNTHQGEDLISLQNAYKHSHLKCIDAAPLLPDEFKITTTKYRRPLSLMNKTYRFFSMKIYAVKVGDAAYIGEKTREGLGINEKNSELINKYNEYQSKEGAKMMQAMQTPESRPPYIKAEILFLNGLDTSNQLSLNNIQKQLNIVWDLYLKLLQFTPINPEDSVGSAKVTCGGVNQDICLLTNPNSTNIPNPRKDPPELVTLTPSSGNNFEGKEDPVYNPEGASNKKRDHITMKSSTTNNAVRNNYRDLNIAVDSKTNIDFQATSVSSKNTGDGNTLTTGSSTNSKKISDGNGNMAAIGASDRVKENIGSSMANGKSSSARAAGKNEVVATKGRGHSRDRNSTNTGNDINNSSTSVAGSSYPDSINSSTVVARATAGEEMPNLKAPKTTSPVIMIRKGNSIFDIISMRYEKSFYPTLGNND
jgi:hypothetical protein